MATISSLDDVKAYQFKSYDDFSTLKSNCRACSVGKVYNCVVQSIGNKVDPRVVIIGEAPGADEIEKGEPFIGKSGQVLRSALKKAGFGHKNSLITNTIPCRPENNKFPKDDCIVTSCKNIWLKKELKLLNPDFILLVGSKSMKFLLGIQGITKNHGKWYKRKLNGKVIHLMPTFHPSYVMRVQYSPDKKHIVQEFEDDIMAMGKAAGFV